MNLLIVITLLPILLLHISHPCQGKPAEWDERCQIIEGDGIQLDECDSKKYLHCIDSRCQCSSVTNVVYTHGFEAPSSSRQKRDILGDVVAAPTSLTSSLGGNKEKDSADAKKTKKPAKGAGSPPSPSPSSSSDNTESSANNSATLKKVYSCYSRAGSPCDLGLNNWSPLRKDGKKGKKKGKKESKEESSSSESEEENEKQRRKRRATSKKDDIGRIPPCVRHALCKRKAREAPPDEDSQKRNVKKVNSDPRVGVCECGPGYVKDPRDMCITVQEYVARNSR